MATNGEKNVFASSWNDSDRVLVVEDQELHVHKWILKSQSPVFTAMFDGDFKEAGQDRITLKGKEYKSMVKFLKILYPSSMFGEERENLDDESVLSVLALADEYQCVNLIKQCINEAEITPGIAVEILPYVAKYHKSALPRLCEVINLSVPTSKLDEVLPTLEGKETAIKLLLTKCHFLESSIVEMQEAIISMMSDILNKNNMLSQYTKSTKSPAYTSFGFGSTTVTVVKKKELRCPHNISIEEIIKAKSCVHCKENYKEKFISPVPSCKNTENFFNMLQKGNEISTVVNDQK